MIYIIYNCKKSERLENFRVKTLNDEQTFMDTGSEARIVILFPPKTFWQITLFLNTF